jgi:hypothetical protein
LAGAPSCGRDQGRQGQPGGRLATSRSSRGRSSGGCGPAWAGRRRRRGAARGSARRSGRQRPPRRQHARPHGWRCEGPRTGARGQASELRAEHNRASRRPARPTAAATTRDGMTGWTPWPPPRGPTDARERSGRSTPQLPGGACWRTRWSHASTESQPGAYCSGPSWSTRSGSTWTPGSERRPACARCRRAERRRATCRGGQLLGLVSGPALRVTLMGCLWHVRCSWEARGWDGGPGGGALPTTFRAAAAVVEHLAVLKAATAAAGLGQAEEGGPPPAAPLHPMAAWLWAKRVIAKLCKRVARERRAAAGVEAKAAAETASVARAALVAAPAEGAAQAAWVAARLAYALAALAGAARPGGEGALHPQPLLWRVQHPLLSPPS